MSDGYSSSIAVCPAVCFPGCWLLAMQALICKVPMAVYCLGANPNSDAKTVIFVCKTASKGKRIVSGSTIPVAAMPLPLFRLQVGSVDVSHQCHCKSWEVSQFPSHVGGHWLLAQKHPVHMQKQEKILQVASRSDEESATSRIGAKSACRKSSATVKPHCSNKKTYASPKPSATSMA